MFSDWVFFESDLRYWHHSKGVDTGIHLGDGTVQESGLLGVFIAQAACVVLYLLGLLLYSSPHFWKVVMNRGLGQTNGSTEDKDALQGENFEPLTPGSDVLLKVRGIYHTFTPGCCSSMCNKEAKPIEVLKGLDMDICRGVV